MKRNWKNTMYKKSPIEIVKALLSLGLTQSEIEAHTGIKQPSISRILTGKTKDSRISTMVALEKFYLKQMTNSSIKSRLNKSKAK
ncbi:helix-turn-helix transcriptional regulator [Candidatus Arsenophonus triatominarum]|uniref:helix-turn-helix transcriptional regulator n=1 Tax=Candidatus Arsenophonus triatominarum TaxID=57911 RepID=UPI0009409F61|nr:helix-turn-helix transcriptional regulator [Candidatus Arsenophonus triatominarum]